MITTKGRSFATQVYNQLKAIETREIIEDVKKSCTYKGYIDFPNEMKRTGTVFKMKNSRLQDFEFILEATSCCRADRLGGKHHSARCIKTLNPNSIYVLVVPDDEFYVGYSNPRQEADNNDRIITNINNKHVISDIDFVIKSSQVDGLLTYINEIKGNVFHKPKTLKKYIFNYLYPEKNIEEAEKPAEMMANA